MRACGGASVERARATVCCAPGCQVDVLETINSMERMGQGLHYGAPYPQGSKTFFKTYQDVCATRAGAARRSSTRPTHRLAPRRCSRPLCSQKKVPWSDAFHTYALDWSLGSITCERSVVGVNLLAAHCPFAHRLSTTSTTRK